jgi:hypothetical protein
MKPQRCGHPAKPRDNRGALHWCFLNAPVDPNKGVAIANDDCTFLVMPQLNAELATGPLLFRGLLPLDRIEHRRQRLKWLLSLFFLDSCYASSSKSFNA